MENWSQMDQNSTDIQPTEPESHPPGEKRPINHGVKVRAKLKRGEGTRDQDTLVIEGRGENAAEAADDFEQSLQFAEENDWGDRLRAIQPESPTDDETDGDS